MKRFLIGVVEEFDNVIFDSPPVLASADAILLGSLTDGVVLCVQAGSTPREKVARARDELSRSRVHILGVLMNNLKDESRRGTARGSYAPSEKSVLEAADVPSPKAVTAVS
jgi:Mrp family chromosome partitioning ATPase